MISHSKLTYIFMLFTSLTISACGEFTKTSWLELMERGKEIRSDTTLPDQERFALAERQYLKALNKMERALGRSPINTKDMRQLFDEIESIFRTQGKYAELEPYLKRKIEVYIKYLGENAMLTGSAHEGLGNLYKQLNRNREAAGEYQQAMKVYQVNGRKQAVQKMESRIQILASTDGDDLPQMEEATVAVSKRSGGDFSGIHGQINDNY